MLQSGDSDTDQGGPGESLGHSKGLRGDTAAPSYSGNDDKESYRALPV